MIRIQFLGTVATECRTCLRAQRHINAGRSASTPGPGKKTPPLPSHMITKVKLHRLGCSSPLSATRNTRLILHQSLGQGLWSKKGSLPPQRGFGQRPMLVQASAPSSLRMSDVRVRCFYSVVPSTSTLWKGLVLSYKPRGQPAASGVFLVSSLTNTQEEAKPPILIGEYFSRACPELAATPR